jgi:hypothetical protein
MKQAQRLANRVKAADCVAPRGEKAAAINERMSRETMEPRSRSDVIEAIVVQGLGWRIVQQESCLQGCHWDTI